MIDMYLQSPAATKTVALLLCGWSFDPPKPDADEEALLAAADPEAARWGSVETTDNPGRSLSAMGSTWGVTRDGAWARVTLTCIGMRDIFSAYYRPQGERFIVTDAGDGLRTRCLQTGTPEIVGLPRRILGTMADAGGRMFACAESHGNDGRLLTVSGADLASSICRVMLASYQVAHGEGGA